MADGSLTTTAAASAVKDYEGTLLIGQEQVLDFTLPVEAWGPANVREVSGRLLRIANSTVRMASCRGDDETDPVGTLVEVIQGASLLLQLAVAATEAADTAEKGVSHG